jgi:hypothetical protein
MATQGLRDSRPAYVRFWQLLLGEVVGGLFLYAVFTFLPTAVQMAITLISYAVIANDVIFHPEKNKSLGSLLCAITAIPAVSCGIAWRITHEDVWSRLTLTGACLMAALIFFDRRADARD